MRLRGTPHLQHRVPLYSTEKTGYVAYLRTQLSCETCLTRHSSWQLVVQCNQIKRGVTLDAAAFWQLKLFVLIASSSDKSLRAAGCHSRVLRFDGAISAVLRLWIPAGLQIFSLPNYRTCMGTSWDHIIELSTLRDDVLMNCL